MHHRGYGLSFGLGYQLDYLWNKLKLNQNEPRGKTMVTKYNSPAFPNIENDEYQSSRGLSKLEHFTLKIYSSMAANGEYPETPTELMDRAIDEAMELIDKLEEAEND